MSLKQGLPEAEHLIQKAIDKGIKFFDTAGLYEKGECLAVNYYQPHRYIKLPSRRE